MELRKSGERERDVEFGCQLTESCEEAIEIRTETEMNHDETFDSISLLIRISMNFGCSRTIDCWE